MIKQRTFYIAEHGKKERVYKEVLQRAGWRRVTEPRLATVSLFDSDGTELRNQRIDAVAGVTKVVIYPHAAHPPFWYDCGFHWTENVHTNILIAEGHRELLKCLNYPRPVKVFGWTYCEQRNFHPSRQVKNILFAPRHANGNGWLADVDRENNNRAAQLLINLCREHDMHLTIRFLGSLQNICVPADVKDVTYIRGFPDLSTQEIDKADIVVSTQTYAYLSVARGKPTVFYSEFTPPHYGNTPETNRYAAGWDCYRQLYEYPLDLFNGDAYDKLKWAAEDGKIIEKWKQDNIGEPFKHNKFVDFMESLRNPVR